MTQTLTAVMYHYVRPIAESSYPGIKGLELQDFRGQLDYIARHYNVVSMESVINAVIYDKALPSDPLLLTFDDGYSDHFANVFPELMRRKMQGSFFVPAQAVSERCVLDVNKVHFVLACSTDKAPIVDRIEKFAEANRERWSLRPAEDFRAEFWKANEWDAADVVFIKRMLQKGLPEELRSDLANELFAEFVSTSESDFATDLYVSVQQLRTMRDAGMHIGGHGYGHYWLASLSEEAQYHDIHTSRRWLLDNGLTTEDTFTFCYPYGSFDECTLRILENAECRLAFTTVATLATLAKSTRLQIERLDTNHLPRMGAADRVVLK